MYTEAIEALGIGISIFEQRDKIAKLLKRLRYRIKNGTLRIVTFGPGGVGKSTLGKILSGALDIRKATPKYEESSDIEKFDLNNDISGELIVGPGQERRSTGTWHELYRKLSHGKSRGVLNVVSYGYHSFAEIGYKELKQYQSNLSKKQVIEQYLEDSRQEELRIIKEIAPRIKDAKENIWMITLVTKQDLWWNERKKVHDFYAKGPYNDFIKEITDYRGHKNFQHEYLSVSLVISNFIDGLGEILAPTTGGYDQGLQNSNMSMFMNTINTFAKRSE